MAGMLAPGIVGGPAARFESVERESSRKMQTPGSTLKSLRANPGVFCFGVAPRSTLSTSLPARRLLLRLRARLLRLGLGLRLRAGLRLHLRLRPLLRRLLLRGRGALGLRL